MSVDVEKLVPGVTVRLPEAAEPAEIVAVTTGEYWTFFYRDAHGLGEITLSEQELGGVVLVERLEQPTFDADPHRFRLGLEARRIKTAFTYEMGAVAVSNIQPLPHQLEAVYDEFLRLPRQGWPDPGRDRKARAEDDADSGARLPDSTCARR
jgi:hypothetical protein